MKTIKDNIVGGPSIVFHRLQQSGVTKIREAEFGALAKITAAILGFDANALYLWSLMQVRSSSTSLILIFYAIVKSYVCVLSYRTCPLVYQ